MSRTIVACRSCGHDELRLIMSFGQTPLANGLLDEHELDQPEETFPLDLVYCPECSLVQITETVPPEKLFREYVYFSSFSDSVLLNAQVIAERMIQQRDLDKKSLVVEIASNDGYLLQFYRRLGIRVLGIEPALNIARVAEERGIPTLEVFFGETIARELAEQGDRADVIHANNVVAHMANLNGVAAGIGILLKNDGVAVIEVPYVRDLVEQVEFDTIYHEHLCYFSLTSLHRLFTRHGMTIAEVERLSIHGGSLRITVQLNENRPRSSERGPDSVKELMREEEDCGVIEYDFYSEFASGVDKLRSDLLELLRRLKSEGTRIAVYGASAKGSTLLNYFGIGQGLLDFVVDRSTVKQGLYTPGTHLQIYSPEKLIEERPDYVLLLSWNVADEILAQQEAYRQQGGKFIIPIPELRIA